ncbi:MAG: 4a-hydroxytetrahydrobiopterin dehydratase [Cyanothece sp. SIO1E1]|nr:4a-hydroxytetrahydrobiopterin dehydratase [Cyanothece sp. SIO1E1]
MTAAAARKTGAESELGTNHTVPYPGIKQRPFAGIYFSQRPSELLDEATIATYLEDLPNWSTDGQQIYTTCHFKDFVANINFVNRLVEPAETMGHHPDLAIAYNQLTISLTTHSAGGLTDQDFALATRISELVATAAISTGSVGCKGDQVTD